MSMLLPLPFLVPAEASAPLTGALVASVWQGVVITALVAVCLRLVSGLSSAARAAVWTAMLFLVGGLPLLFLLPRGAAPTRPAVLHGGNGISEALLLVWAIASAARLLQLGHGAIRLHGILRRATPIEAAEPIASWLDSGFRRTRLCVSEDVDRPSVAGFFRPDILLPTELLSHLREADLRQIVLHEMEHLRRWDDWINLLQQVSLVLFPLNPALYWLNRRLAAERELACDDGVLRMTHARKAYAACLTRVAETSLLRRGAALALGVLGDWIGQWHRRPELARRVERILRHPSPAMSQWQSRLATGTLLVLMTAGTALLAHGPELVSFSPLPQTSLTQTAALRMTPLATRPWSENVSLDRRTARPMLVNAAMTGRTAGVRPALAILQSHSSGHRVPVRKRLRPRATPRFMLTSWHAPVPSEGMDWAPVRLTPVVFHSSQDPQIWYTAVPLRDGWLVVQL